jgi:hypothetical protein
MDGSISGCICLFQLKFGNFCAETPPNRLQLVAKKNGNCQCETFLREDRLELWSKFNDIF